MPCGSDQALYLYDYSGGRPRRVLENLGTREHDESICEVQFSKPDSNGNRSILILRNAIQCGSSWNRLAYDLYRYSGGAGVVGKVLEGDHGIWFGNYAPLVQLTFDELLLEVRDRSIDGGLHNRAHILHYKESGSSMERVDPIALQPHDFVDEWLTRRWPEMERWSDPGMKGWHEFLASEPAFGEIQLVQRCTERGLWQVRIHFDQIQGKRLPEAVEVYFLVEQSDTYRFRMREISFHRQEGCPGESAPPLRGPSLLGTNQVTSF